MIEDNEEFLNTLRLADRLVYLCGAGFSMSIAEHDSNWDKWIRTGASYLEKTVRENIDNKLSSGESDDMIRAAGQMLEGLKSEKQYEDFMDATIGTIKAAQKDLMEAAILVSRSGDYFATTNYDMGIEVATGLGPETYRTPGGILNVIRASCIIQI